MEDLSITINIAGRQYRLKINSEDKTLFERAETELNKLMKEYAENFAYKDHQDLIAMVALQEAVSSIKNQNEVKEIEEKIEVKLEHIINRIDNSLD